MVQEDPDWRSPYGFPQVPQARMPTAHGSYLLNHCLREQRGVGGTAVGVTGDTLLGDLVLGVVDTLLFVLRIWESCPHGFWAVSPEAIAELNPEPFRCSSCQISTRVGEMVHCGQCGRSLCQGCAALLSTIAPVNGQLDRESREQILAQWHLGPEDPIPRSVILPPAPAFRTALTPLLLPRGLSTPERYWGHWNLRDGTAQEPGPPPVIRQALQSLHQRSSTVRRLTLDRESSFEQHNAMLSSPGLAELVGRAAPRPPRVAVGLARADSHQAAASNEVGEDQMEPDQASETDGEASEDLDTDGHGNTFPADSDGQGHFRATLDPGSG